MSDIATGKDADFSEERLIERYNSDLANSLGNLLNRTLNMTQKYLYRTVRKQEMSDEQFHSDLYVTRHVPAPPMNLEASLRVVHTYPHLCDYAKELDHCRSDASLEEVIKYGRICDCLVEMAEPWKLAADDTKRKILDDVLYHLVEALESLRFGFHPCCRVRRTEFLIN
jgi:methionyl-tRNA synthetase